MNNTDAYLPPIVSSLVGGYKKDKDLNKKVTWLSGVDSIFLTSPMLNG